MPKSSGSVLSSQDAEGELVEIGDARAWNGMEGLEGRMTGWMTAGGNNKATTESDDGWPWALGWDLPSAATDGDTTTSDSTSPSGSKWLGGIDGAVK